MAAGIGRSTNSIIAGLQRVAPAAQRVVPAVQTAFRGMTVVAGAASAAWNVAGLALVGYNGNLEQLQASFEVMTGSAAKGAQVLQKVRDMGASTPFEMEGLAETTLLLMNYNFTADEALNRMSMLGDISQGNQDKLTRIATAYGQMHSAQKVSLEDIKQMIEAGFNPLVEISEATGESMASLYDRISKGTMAVDEITASMQRSTSEGGKYFQSMLKQSQTLNGQLSTLKDNAMALGGNLFQSYTDGIRDDVLPMANDVVETLNTAFEQGGAEGLTAAVMDQLPVIGNAAKDALLQGFKGVQKQAPKLMRDLIGMLPGAIRGAGSLVVGMGDLFFDLAAAGVEGLFAHSGELAGMVLDVSADILGNAASGVFDLALGVGRGIGTSLKKAGVLGWSTDELVDMLFGGYDADRVAELKAQVSIEPEVTVSDGGAELKSVYDMIEEQLTDGEEDTPEVVEALKRQVTEYYQEQIAQVNAWRTEALAGLDQTLPEDEYAAAAASINSSADSMVEGLEKASDETVRFIQDNAGKSTDAVRENVGDLETIYQTAVGYSNKIATLNGETVNMGERQRQVVASGQSRDEVTQLSAIAYTAMEYESALQTAEEIKAAAMEQALAKFDADSDAYAQEEARIMEEYDTKVQAARRTYITDMNQVWSGIIQAMAPDQQALIHEVASGLQVRDLAEYLLGSMTTAVNEVGASLDADAYTDWYINMLSGMGLTDVDYTILAQQLGIDEIDPAKIQQILAQQLSAATAGQGVNSAIGVALQDLIIEADGNLQTQLPQLMEDLPQEVKNVVQASVESGWLQACSEADLSGSEELLSAMAGILSPKAGFGMIKDFTGGMDTGLKQEGNRIVRRATSIAQSMVNAFRSTLQIRSPSRVMMKIGEQTGAGFDQGMGSTLRTAVKNAQTIVGGLNLSPRMTLPDLSGAFESAVSLLDADRQQQPLYLVLDGHVVAQLQAGNNARAIGMRNKSIALGVGRCSN